MSKSAKVQSFFAVECKVFIELFQSSIQSLHRPSLVHVEKMTAHADEKEMLLRFFSFCRFHIHVIDRPYKSNLDLFLSSKYLKRTLGQGEISWKYMDVTAEAPTNQIPPLTKKGRFPPGLELIGGLKPPFPPPPLAETSNRTFRAGNFRVGNWNKFPLV